MVNPTTLTGHTPGGGKDLHKKREMRAGAAMSKLRKRNSPRTKAFLATKEGQAWLEAKIKEKHANRPDPGPSPFPPTKFPFAATINGKPVTVWPDWIEHESDPFD